MDALERHADVFGQSEKMRALGAIVARLAPLPTSVLIRGENGVGKERVAHALHSLSDRAAAAFVKVGCASLPGNLLGIDLFGDDRSPGRLDTAAGGTLFFDEIDRMPGDLQARVAAALEARALRIRVLASTSSDMYGLVATGRFRSDLYETLAINTIDVPPLRERREEIGHLLRHFLTTFGRQFERPVPTVSESTAQILVGYDWPGNIRELEDLVKRWVVLGDEARLRAEVEARATASQRRRSIANGTTPGLRDIARRAAQEAERLALQAALERSGGNRAAAARELRVSYKTLLQKLAQAGLSAAQRKRRHQA
jgi:two-component system response regulator AtoC